MRERHTPALMGQATRAGAGCGAQLVALVAALALGYLLITTLVSALDPMQREARQAELYRRQQLAEDMYPVDRAVAAGWRLLPLALVAGAGAVALVILYRQLAAWQTIRANKMIALTRAQMQRFPEGLQTLAFHDSSRAEGVGAPPMLAPPAWGDEAGDAGDDEATAERLPAFSALLDGGRVGKGAPLLLGYDLDAGGAELPGAWLDLYATATAGLPGSGKTTSQRFFAAQTALHGARFVVCDPHAGAGEDSLAATLDPLRGVYLCEPAEDPRAILEAVRYVADLGESRVKGRSADRTPVILWVDELTSLLGRSDVGAPLAELLERVAQEYRKRGVYLSASGQIWSAARTTSELRDSLASVLCHRMKRSQARLLLPTDEAPTVERLATGEAILWRTNGATARVKIPNTTAADVARVAGLLTDTAPRLDLGGFRSASATLPPRAPADAPRTRFGSGLDGASVVTSSAPASPAAAPGELDPATARILARFAAGATLPELVRELAGTTSGRKADEARAQVEAALRRAVGGVS